MERTVGSSSRLRRVVQWSTIIATVCAVVAITPRILPPSGRTVAVYFYDKSLRPCTSEAIVVIAPHGGRRVYPNDDGIIHVPATWCGKEISVRNRQAGEVEIWRGKVIPDKDGKMVVVLDINCEPI